MQLMVVAPDKGRAKKLAQKQVGKGEFIDSFEFVGRKFGMSNYRITIAKKRR